MFSFLLTLMIAPTPPAAAPGTPAVRAELELVSAAHLLTVVGYGLNAGPAPVRCRYELQLQKRGGSGVSSNRQGGAVALLPGQRTRLSSTTINVTGQDYYRVRLRLLDEQGRVVAADSVEQQPAAQPAR